MADVGKPSRRFGIGLVSGATLAFVIGTVFSDLVHDWAASELCIQAGYSSGVFNHNKGIVCTTKTETVMEIKR